MSTTMQPADRADRAARSGGRTSALAVVAATVATLVVWAIARPLAGADLTVRTGAGSAAQHVGPTAVVVATVLAGLAGWALLALLQRFTSRARAIWITTALVVLVLSMAGPLGAGTTVTAAAILASMHLTAAAILIPGLARS